MSHQTQLIALHVNQESRQETLRFYTLLNPFRSPPYKISRGKKDRLNQIYFNIWGEWRPLYVFGSDLVEIHTDNGRGLHMGKYLETQPLQSLFFPGIKQLHHLETRIVWRPIPPPGLTAGVLKEWSVNYRTLRNLLGDCRLRRLAIHVIFGLGYTSTEWRINHLETVWNSMLKVSAEIQATFPEYRQPDLFVFHALYPGILWVADMINRHGVKHRCINSDPGRRGIDCTCG